MKLKQKEKKESDSVNEIGIEYLLSHITMLQPDMVCIILKAGRNADKNNTIRASRNVRGVQQYNSTAHGI